MLYVNAFSQFIPFSKDRFGNVLSFQFDDITVGCLTDLNCGKKIWVQNQKANNEKDLFNVTIKCPNGELTYNYFVKYNSQGKQIVNKKVSKIEKIVPGTPFHKIYDMVCNPNADGPAYSMDIPDNISSNFTVSSNKAYFHSQPNTKFRKSAFLVYGDTIYPLKETKYFVYIEFENQRGQITSGWILKSDIR